MGETVKRPCETARRSDYYKSVAEKHGVRTEIIATDLDWETAGWWEQRWISALRKAGYRLVNIADGGDGLSSRAAKEVNGRPEVRAKHRTTQRRPDVVEKKRLGQKLAHARKPSEQKVEESAKISAGLLLAFQRPEVIENHKAAQNTPEIIAVKSANTKAWLNSLTPEDWDRMNAQRLAKHTVEERSEFGKRGWQTRVENGDTEFTDEHRANISLSVQAWRDSQTDTEKSEQSLKIWDSRRKNGTGTPKRDENGVSLDYIKSLETRAKNGTLTSSKDMWDNMSEEDRKDISRRMSEGKKRAKEAREAAAKLKELKD
jgi:glycine cleavage system H lipoate-binding protein